MENIRFPWTATIDKSYFDIIERKPIYNTANKGKIKYYPEDFCKEFQKEWIWEASLEEIINVNLNPMLKGKKEYISSQDLKERLIKYGTEEWWTWNDVFGIGEKNIKYQYEKLSLDVKGSVLSGNIIQYFKEKNKKIGLER